VVLNNRNIAYHREEKDLLEIAEAIAELRDKRTLDLSQLPESISRRIMEHYNEFRWINTDDIEGNPWELQDFMERIGTLIKKDCKKILKRIEEEAKTSENEVRNLISKRHNSIEGWVEDLGKLINFRNYRAELIVKLDFSMWEFLEEMGKRRGVNFNEIRYYTHKEILSLLREGKKVESKEIKNQKIGICCARIAENFIQ